MLQRLDPLACPTNKPGVLCSVRLWHDARTIADRLGPVVGPSSAPSSSDSQDSSFVRRHTESTDPELERLLFAMIAAVLDAQCEANRDLRNEAPTRFDSISRQPISTVDYLARLRNHTRFDRLCFPIALGLLLRLCGSAGADHPDSFVRSHRFCPTYHNVHRLVIAALLVASKLNDDVHHFNRHMSECGGVSLAELNALELELCTRLRWRLVLGKDEFARVVDALRDRRAASGGRLPTRGRRASR